MRFCILLRATGVWGIYPYRSVLVMPAWCRASRTPNIPQIIVRDTPQECKFAERSLLAIASLKPDELIVDVVEPAPISLILHIRSLCGSYDVVRIVDVPKSDAWGFQQVHVHWHCYRERKHDRILLFDIELILRVAVLDGLCLIGEDNTTCASYAKRALIKTPQDRIRYVLQRHRVRIAYDALSRLHWLWRPYCEDIYMTGIRQIRNGVDMYVYGCIRRARRRVIIQKTIGADCLDYANHDHPWRQFHDGIWYGANHTMRRILRAIITSALYRHQWIVRGYWWALCHPGHEAIRAAHYMTRSEWNTVGSVYVKTIRDWKEIGTEYG